MWQQLEGEIEAVCHAKILRHQRRRSQLAAAVDRRAKRSTVPVVPVTDALPELWASNKNLNPYDVLRRSHSLAFGIKRAMEVRSYSPRPPTIFPVPKSTGLPRSVFTFEIADEAVSRLLFRSITRKNRALFGAHSYAYRENLGVYDAIRYISSEWVGKSRIFVAEYDFRAYFASIEHQYLFENLAKSSVLATSLEKSLCRQFVSIAAKPANPYQMPRNSQDAVRGIPQGTTISLFLANLAMLPLDRALEGLGVSFTRYADDVLLWSDDYGRASKAVTVLHEWSKQSGVQLNLDKSRGLRLMVTQAKPETEFESVESVDYLGHRISLTAVQPKKSRIIAIRKDIERLIYVTLLKEPMQGTQVLARVSGGLDRDYVSLIWQLRRKLYGSLSERQLQRLRRGHVPATGLSGVVAQFPVVTNREEYRLLDVWLRRQVWLALRKRASLLRSSLGRRRVPRVWDLALDDLVTAQGKSVKTRQNLDLTMPSANVMAELVQRSIQLHGPAIVRGSSRLYLTP